MEVKAKNYIVSVVTNEQLELVLNQETAFDMLAKFDSLYLKQSTALQIISRRKLESIRLDDGADPIRFFNDSEKAVNSLKTASGEVTEDEKANYMIRALRESLAHLGDLVDVIENTKENVFEYLKYKITVKAKSNGGVKGSVSGDVSVNTQVYAAKAGGRGSGNGSNFTCYRCGEDGHRRFECPSLGAGNYSRGNGQKLKGNFRGCGYGRLCWSSFLKCCGNNGGQYSGSNQHVQSVNSFYVKLGLHESKSEKYIAVDVESIDEFPSIERVDETILGDEDDENEDDEDEYDSETVTNTQITDSSDRNWVGQIKSNLHQKPRVKFPVQKTSTVTDTFGDNDTSKNLPPSHILPVHAVQPHNRTENEDEPEKVVSNESINRRLEKESNKFGLAPDSNLNRSDVKSSDEKVKIHPNNHNTESENEHRGKIERNHSRLKRSGFPSLDSAQSLLNSVTPTSFSVTIDGPKGTYQFPSNSWPAAHFDSHTPSKLTEPKVPNDCPIEIKNNNRKWKPTITPGGEHFDLKNNEYITIKEEGLYFVYSQIIFYRDKSMFGYSIENQQQRILQCSIHSPVNRTNSGSGTSCFTAGLVYLNQNDVLKLELHNDSGKCVQWGPKKSFIGLFKLPTNSN